MQTKNNMSNGQNDFISNDIKNELINKAMDESHKTGITPEIIDTVLKNVEKMTPEKCKDYCESERGKFFIQHYKNLISGEYPELNNLIKNRKGFDVEFAKVKSIRFNYGGESLVIHKDIQNEFQGFELAIYKNPERLRNNCQYYKEELNHLIANPLFQSLGSIIKSKELPNEVYETANKLCVHFAFGVYTLYRNQQLTGHEKIEFNY